jgi:hypothetical protein
VPANETKLELISFVLSQIALLAIQLVLALKSPEKYFAGTTTLSQKFVELSSTRDVEETETISQRKATA